MKIYKIIILITTLIESTKATPKCITKKQSEVFCSAGNEDFILKRGLVSDNNNTILLNLSNCRIKQIDLESFHLLYKLKYLDLSFNKIDKLRLGVFDGSKTVVHLNLSNNYLSVLELGIFDGMPNLELLNLKANKLTNIKLGVFDPFTKIIELDLSDNLLEGKTISPYIFDRSIRMKILNFSGNDMTESPDNLLHALRHLSTLYLNGCSLNEIPAFVQNTRSLKSLNLAHNNITKLTNLNIFSNLTNIEILDLSLNKIDEIDEKTFKALTKLKKIVLNRNELTRLHDTLFQQMPQLVVIDLSHNKLENVPVNALRTPKLKYLNLSDNRFTYLQDNFNLELLNSGVKLVKFYINDNPWQCACLKDVLKELKLYKVVYNSFKFNGQRKNCVTTREFVCKRQPMFNEIYNDLYYNKNM